MRYTEWIEGEHRAIPRTDLRRCGYERCTTRLAEYEDTDLTVEQVQQLKKLNKPTRPDFEGDGYADGELVYIAQFIFENNFSSSDFVCYRGTEIEVVGNIFDGGLNDSKEAKKKLIL